MRRVKPIKERKIVHSIYPIIFWKECVVCQLQFRRERGWWFKGVALMMERPPMWYVCNACAPTQQDAIKIAKEKGAV